MPLLCHWSRLFVSLQVGIPLERVCLCPTLGMSCAWLAVPLPPVSLRRVDRLVSGVLMDVVVGIVYGWPIEPRFLRDLSNVCHWPLWLWCHLWNHPLMHQWLWYPLLRGLMLQDGLMTAVTPPVWVRIGVVSLDHLCPRIHLEVDHFLGLLSLHWQLYIPLVQVWCQRVTSNREKLARQLSQCMSMRFSRVHVSGSRLRLGLFLR